MNKIRREADTEWRGPSDRPDDPFEKYGAVILTVIVSLIWFIAALMGRMAP